MTQASAATPSASALPAGYLQRSAAPLPSLLFLVPLLVVYELGMRHYSSDIIAFALLQDFFRLFGAQGRYLPALAVVVILFIWHIARNDSWRVAPSLCALMALESAGLAAPLIILSLFARQHLPLYASEVNWQGMLVLSLGAGVYEELVFRLIAFSILSLVLSDLLKSPKWLSMLLIVVIPAILFSLYHYWGPEQFAWRSFVFRTAAGVYFGLVFLLRGFGITAGTHAAYDVLVVLLTASA